VDSLRPALQEDVAAIRRLVRTGGINPFGLHWPRFIVIENKEGVVACGQVKSHGDGTLELASIAVDSAERGKGHARRIIEHLIQANHGPLYLTCRASLGALYEKFGFHRLDPQEMSPYFRRLSSIVNWFYHRKIAPEAMLVMRNTLDDRPGY
jgi:N-acetylglutamate synthase-like GNAT family acetyltransferase